MTVPERQPSIRLDQTVEVSKSEIPRQHSQILRMSLKIRPQLHHLGRKNPGPKHRKPSRGSIPRMPQQIRQSNIIEQRKVEKRSNINRINTPRLPSPNRPIRKQTRRIRPPRRPHPSQTLLHEFRISPQRRLNTRIIRILNLDLPPVRDFEASDVVIIIGIQGSEHPKEESLIRKPRKEIFMLQNLRPMEGGPSGNHKDSPVNGVRGADFEIVTFEIEGSEHVPVGEDIET